MSGYVLEHTDTAGVTHRWTVGDLSAHYVAGWLARDSGVPFTVLRDGVRVATWSPQGGCDPPYAWVDDDEDDPDSPPYATLSAEQPPVGGVGCAEPAEDVSEGCDEPVYCRPIIDYVLIFNEPKPPADVSWVQMEDR